MSYQLFITQSAERDLEEAADYIEYILRNPAAAEHLYDLTEDKMMILAKNPKMCPLVDDPVLMSWGIRIAVVNNYLAFYTIDDELERIYLVRFLYRKRDWISILRQGI